MKFFGAFPIKTKIIILLLFVSLATLIISSTFFIYNDLNVFKKNLLKNLTILAGTVGANSRAAVYFEDKATATEILSSLEENSQIQSATIYDSKGEIFVTYQGKDSGKKSSAIQENATHIFKEGIIELKQPIILKNKKIGEIYLSADLREYNTVLRKYLFIVGIILFFTFGIALIISILLQRLLSKPILTLANATKEISKNNDYSIRVNHQSQDEIGDLYLGFNHMISRIEKREKELAIYRKHLEAMVEEKTADLLSANKELNKYKFKLEDLVKKRTKELASTNESLKKEIEQRSLVESYLKHYSDELKRSNQELHDFASIASHDLQEPLRKIITFGDRLAAQVQDIDEKGEHYLERMQNAAQRMKEFIDDLLEYSKIETKAKPFEKTDLNTIVPEVLENLEIQINKTQAQIRCGKLPILEVDSFQIRQLFQNLIGNAIKYNKADDSPNIEISARSNEKGFWEISVKDNGIGFDEKYIDRIFKPFERLHGKLEYEGSGMGLTICQKIVKRHGGRISVTSIPQKGSTFKISLPETQKREKESMTFPLEYHF
jgi:signal transduction histidine kinase